MTTKDVAGAGASVPKRPPPRARARVDTKQKAVEMLVAGTPVGDVAKALGVDRRTVHRWSKLGSVARQIEKSIADAVERGRGRLLALVDLSVVVVRECLDCSAESKADASAMRVRLEAAKLVFDRVGLCPKQEVEVTNQSLVNLVDKFGGA